MYAKFFFAAALAMTFGLPVSVSFADAARIQSTTVGCRQTEPYSETVALWRKKIRPAVANRIEIELIQKGNPQVLYDVQADLHNFLIMIRRCQDYDLLDELAHTLIPAFDGLTKDTRDGKRKWICKSGPSCTEASKRINREVELYSLQFLGLISSVLSAISEVPPIQHTAAMGAFARQAIDVVWADHVTRLASDSLIRELINRTEVGGNMRMQDRARHSIHDRHIWMLTIIPDFVAAIKVLDPRKWKEILSSTEFQRVQKVFVVGIAFVRTRLTLAKETSYDGQVVTMADLDRSMWRHHLDNRYAGYSGEEKPVVCSPIRDAHGRIVDKKKEVVVRPETVPIVDSGGRDISHMRRLVPFFDTLQRTREVIKQHLLQDLDTHIPPETRSAFAAALVGRIWNGDRQFPLFANYWDGTRGWYRVGYEEGDRGCFEGYSPYALSYAFLTGGFLFWADDQPMIQELGTRLYKIIKSSSAADVAFLEQRYKPLSATAPEATRLAQLFRFLPALAVHGTPSAGRRH
jgi:hypothetical protein